MEERQYQGLNVQDANQATNPERMSDVVSDQMRSIDLGRSFHEVKFVSNPTFYKLKLWQIAQSRNH